MTKQKELYSSPKTDILVVRFEENLLQGSSKSMTTQMSRGGYEYNDLG